MSRTHHARPLDVFLLLAVLRVEPLRRGELGGRLPVVLHRATTCGRNDEEAARKLVTTYQSVRVGALLDEHLADLAEVAVSRHVQRRHLFLHGGAATA